MNLRISYILALAMCLGACNHEKNDELAHHHHHGHEEAVHEDHHEDHDGDHDEDHNEDQDDGEISLDEATQALFGVRSETIAPADFHEVLTVSGAVVDSPSSASVISAPTAGIVKYATGITTGSEVTPGRLIATVSAADISGGSSDKASKAAYDAAKREFDRVAALYKDGLVTVKAYNDALAALEQAKASHSEKAASGKASAATSGVITSVTARDGEYVDAGAPLASVSSNRALTLRADVPQRHFRSVPAIKSATVKAPYSDDVIDLTALGARVTNKGNYNVGDAGYVPVYFSFTNDGSLIPGTMVTVNLLGQTRHDVVAVPVTALSEQQGTYFVYERLDEDCFRKIPVKTGASDGLRTEIVSGLSGGEDIVVEGTVAVRLAESSNIVPEGHSHNH